MADFFEKIKHAVEDGFDDVKKDVEKLGEDMRAHDDAENAIYDWANGDILTFPYFTENAAENDVVMKTLATILMKDDKVVSPADGMVAAIDEDSNMIGIALSREVVVAVKLCTKDADISKDCKVLVKDGDYVKKGQTLIQFDKEVSAKSKLLLIVPDTTDAFKQLGFKPAAKEGAAKAGDKLISK